MLAQAVILTGGKGVRLGGITALTPKPLLPVGGKPFIEHLLQEVSRFGFQSVTFLAGHMGEQFRTIYDGRTMLGMDVEVVVEPYPLGTAGALGFAAHQGKLQQQFLLMNGDSWIDADLASFAFDWAASYRLQPELQVQVLLHQLADRGRYGAVSLENGLVRAFEEKPSDEQPGTGYINAGVYILDRALTAALPAGVAQSLETDVLPCLAQAGRVAGVVAPPGSYFIDIGLPQSLEESRSQLLEHRRRPALFLDRDGTLNRDSGYTYRQDHLVWQPQALEAVKFANRAGYFVFVVTNQSGVARGYYGEEVVSAFHRAMQAELLTQGAHVDAFHYCPHHEEAISEKYRKACRCRKPLPGMIEELAASWPIDMHRSLLIGDTESDMQAARAAGICGVMYSGGSLLQLVREHIFTRGVACG